MFSSQPPWPREPELLAATLPPSAPEWDELVGEYFGDHEWLSMFEAGGQLWATFNRGETQPVQRVDRDQLQIGGDAPFRAERDRRGRIDALCSRLVRYRRLELSDDPQWQFVVEHALDPGVALGQALAEPPPIESGDFETSDLVDLATLDPTLGFDLRYAATNNFLGYAFYQTPRALAQRAIADAVIRAHRALRRDGYGLVVLDAYRPWSVTQAFWLAMPEPSRWMIADPARGSRHNRGAAVDVTLQNLESATLVQMPSTFDEPTPRAYAFYPGGTSERRWYRALLRRAMEAEGFIVNDREWWHFDHRDWPRYRIENITF